MITKVSPWLTTPEPLGFCQVIENVSPLTVTGEHVAEGVVQVPEPPAVVGAATGVPVAELVAFCMFTLKLLGAVEGRMPATKMLTPFVILVTVMVTVGLPGPGPGRGVVIGETIR